MRRAMYLVPVLVLALLPMSADAQGRSGKAKSGGGPAFCRSGAGHPVFGWEWCRERGWGNSSAARNDRIVRGGRGDAYPDRDRDRRLNDVAFDNGYADGYEKGLDDARDGRSADPTRHGWYRSARPQLRSAVRHKSAVRQHLSRRLQVWLSGWICRRRTVWRRQRQQSSVPVAVLRSAELY